jgi:hypothetical protein
MTFSNQQLGKLVSALPDCTSRHRRAVLRRILKEWSQRDLEEHLSEAEARQVRAERRQLEKLGRQADVLAQTLSVLDLDCRFAIASQLVQPGANTRTIGPGFRPVKRMDRFVEKCPARLRQLARAAALTADVWTPPPLRAETLRRHLVLQDFAAIFEWATGLRAGRRVRTDVSEDDAGKEYGPFYDFARAVWPMIFGSEKGLGNAIRTWAKLRAQHPQRSPVIANMHMRHPEWRIRDR